MRISDWSSDVCSSDLTASRHCGAPRLLPEPAMSLSNPISSKRTAPRLATLAVAMLLAVGTATSAHAGAQEDARSANAVRVLTDIQAIPESAIPDQLLDEARALEVVPAPHQVGLVPGGRPGPGRLPVTA